MHLHHVKHFADKHKSWHRSRLARNRTQKKDTDIFSSPARKNVFGRNLQRDKRDERITVNSEPTHVAAYLQVRK